MFAEQKPVGTKRNTRRAAVRAAALGAAAALMLPLAARAGDVVGPPKPATVPVVIIRPAAPKNGAPARPKRAAAKPSPPAAVSAANPAAARTRAARPAGQASKPTAAAPPPGRPAARQTESPRARRLPRIAAAPEERKPRERVAAYRSIEEAGGKDRPAAHEPRDQGEGAAALNARAHRLQLQGRHAEAEPLLRRALEIKPDYSFAVYNLGWSLVAQGKAKEALGPLSRAIRLEPARWEPYQKLSEAYSLLGEMDKAQEAREIADALRRGRGASGSPPAAQSVVALVSDEAYFASTDRRELIERRQKLGQMPGK